MSRGQEKKIYKKFLELKKRLLPSRMERCKDSFSYFLFNFVKTHDEHDRKTPIKRVERKQYLKELAVLMQNEKMLIVEKSRQMMVSWIACSLCVWQAMYYPGQRIMIQSKKESDADGLVDRCKFIYDNLPKDVKEMYPTKQPFAYLKMIFMSNPISVISGCPQGSDVLRQWTCSLIISDEMAFQEMAEDAFTASKPTLVGGGRIIGISTPNGRGFFWRLAYDIDS